MVIVEVLGILDNLYYDLMGHNSYDYAISCNNINNNVIPFIITGEHEPNSFNLLHHIIVLVIKYILLNYQMD